MHKFNVEFVFFLDKNLLEKLNIIFNNFTLKFVVTIL